MARQSFLTGAFILAAGGLISRGMGAIYRFLLPGIMGGGEQAKIGLFYFNQAYPFYMVLLGISAGGIPSAVAKLVAEHQARGQTASALAVFRLSLVMLAVLGLVLSLGMFFAAPWYAEHVARDDKTTWSFRAVAPAVFLVSVMSAYRGYFQGLQQMTPYAVSQVIEQLVRIGTMLFFAWALLPRGVEWSAAGATFGAVPGAVAGLLYLMYLFKRSRASAQAAPADTPAAGAGRAGADPPQPARAVLAQIVSLAVPISLIGIAQPLISLLDAIIVPSRLHAAGLGSEAPALFGMLTGYALPFIIAPTVFTAALATSLIPAVAEALALGDVAAARHRNNAGIRMTLLICLPAAAGLIALAREIPATFFGAPEAGLPLAVLALSAVFLGLQQTSSAILQGMGAVHVPVRSLIADAAVKIGITWFLAALPAWNVNGAALGTTVGFLVAAWLNNRYLQTRLEYRIPWLQLGGKALLASAGMAVAVRGVCTALSAVGGLKLATLAAVAAGAAIYPLFLMALGGLSARDLEILPGIGPRAAVVCQRLRLVRR